MSGPSIAILRHHGEQLAGIGSMLVSQGEILTDLGLLLEQQYWKGSPQGAAVELAARISEHAEHIAEDAQRVILDFRNAVSGELPRESTKQKQGLEW